MERLDRILLALRATGPDAYRADPEQVGTFVAYCPACASRLTGVRRLRVRRLRGGDLSVTCSTGCSLESIRTALKLAERLEPLLYAGGVSPTDELASIEAELASTQETRRLIAALAREAVHAA